MSSQGDFFSVEVTNPDTPFGGVQVEDVADTPPIQLVIDSGSPVASVFGRVGNILALSSDYAPFYAPIAAGLPLGGSPGQILTKTSSSPYQSSWQNPSAAGLVSSVFGRNGNVAAQSGDYTFAQIGSKPTTLAGYGITDAMPLGGTATDVTFQTVYLGSKARLVPLSNGVKLEVFDGATWQTQAQWTE